MKGSFITFLLFRYGVLFGRMVNGDSNAAFLSLKIHIAQEKEARMQ